MSVDKLIPTNVPGFVKDPKSGAILNINNNNLDQYKKQRAIKSHEDERITKLESEIGDIKNMLLQLLERK